MINLYSYLLVAFFLFLTGILVVILRKNMVAVLLGIELILNASALNFVAYSRFTAKNLDGHIFTLFIIVVAAAEAAVALAIVIRFYQMRESIHLDDAARLQG